jgi:hypothetical protein
MAGNVRDGLPTLADWNTHHMWAVHMGRQIYNANAETFRIWAGQQNSPTLQITYQEALRYGPTSVDSD